MSVRQFGHLFFIPIIPLSRSVQYVECRTCRATFVPEVLNAPGIAQSEAPKAEFEKAIVLIAIAMARSDSMVAHEERKTIAAIYEQIARQPLSGEHFEAQAKLAKKWSFDVSKVVQAIRPRLNDHGRELVLRAAALVALADGHVHGSESKLLSEIARDLEMTPTHTRAVLSELGIKA